MTGCSKSTDSNTTPIPAKSNIERLLDSGKWVLSDIQLYGAGTGATNVATTGFFEFVGNLQPQFRMDGFTFTDPAGNGNGTVTIDGYSAGGTYYFTQLGEKLVIYFNNTNGLGFGGTISVSSTQLILDMSNDPINYFQVTTDWDCSGFKETLTH